MNEVTVTFSDGTKRNYPKGITYEEIRNDFTLKYPCVGVKANNVVFSLDDKCEENCDIIFLNFFDLNGSKMYKHGVEMILEAALNEVFPELEIFYLHSHPKGVYAEIRGNKSLTEEDMRKVKNKMADIVSSNLPIKKHNISKRIAIKCYNEKGYYEKADNVQKLSQEVLTFYSLNNIINYFYTEMPNKTGIMKIYDIKYLGNNKIIVLLPNILTQGRVPEYVEYSGITDSFLDTQMWLDAVDKRFLCDINNDISNGTIKNFIDISEIKFNDQIRNVVKEINNNGRVKFVMVAGPSSSGKTTTTKRLKTYLDCSGYKTVCISTDDYFVNRDDTPKDEMGKFDFECLHAVDVEKLNNDLDALLDGKEINLPEYDFIAGISQRSNRKLKLEKNSIIIIEGLHCLNDDLTPHIPKEYKFKVYISPFIGINVDRHNYISTTDLRFLRRLVRDFKTRGKKVDDTFDYWLNVRKGEVKYIFPYIHQADVVLNTALNFEIGVLKIYAEPLLLSVGIDSPYYEEARRLINALKEFLPIPSEYVSKDSILREFIGGE